MGPVRFCHPFPTLPPSSLAYPFPTPLPPTAPPPPRRHRSLLPRSPPRRCLSSLRVSPLDRPLLFLNSSVSALVVLLLAAMAPAAAAFVGAVGSGATAWRGAVCGSRSSLAGVTLTVARPVPLPPAAAAATPRRVTAPSMNIFDRIWRILRSGVNSAVSSVEDPEKIITQAVTDMQGDLVKVRQAYAEVSASTKRLERQRDLAATTADEWYKRAQLALQKGEDGLAREALTRRKAQQDMVSSLDAQLSGMKENVNKLYSSMNALDSKINEARTKKDQFIARAKTAKTSQQVNQMISGVGDSSALEAFERMKVKVEELETSADVAAEMTIGGSADVSLESKFRALEGNDVDKELAAMKGQLGAEQTPFILPSRPKDKAVEAELDKLRRDFQ